MIDTSSKTAQKKGPTDLQAFIGQGNNPRLIRDALS